MQASARFFSVFFTARAKRGLCGLPLLLFAGLLSGLLPVLAWPKTVQAFQEQAADVDEGPVLFEERREFQGFVRRTMAEKAAKVAALSAACARAELILARNEDLRFADSSGSGGLAAPLPLDGLARQLFQLEIKRTGVEGFPPRLQAVAWASLKKPDNIREKLLEALKYPGKLELYARVVREQRQLLERYDALAARLLPRQIYEDGGQEEAHHLQRLVNEMQALDMLAEVLPDYREQWENPAKVVADLTNAGTLALANPLLLAALAQAELQMDRPVRALELAGRSVALAADFARAHDIKGTALLRQKLPALAEESFGRAVELSPKNADYYVHRAAARLVLEKLPEMCADFASACGLGDCDGLEWGRRTGSCPQGPGTP